MGLYPSIYPTLYGPVRRRRQGTRKEWHQEGPSQNPKTTKESRIDRWIEREREENQQSAENRTIRRFTIPKSQNETDRQKDIQGMGFSLLTVGTSFAIENASKKNDGNIRILKIEKSILHTKQIE